MGQPKARVQDPKPEVEGEEPEDQASGHNDDSRSQIPSANASTSKTDRAALLRQLSELGAQFELIKRQLDPHSGSDSGATAQLNDAVNIDASVAVQESSGIDHNGTEYVSKKDASIQGDESGNAPPSADSGPGPRTVIPELRRVKWAEFKNFSLDEPRIYAIEVLMGNARFYWQKHRDERGFKKGRGQASKPQDTAELIENQVEMPERIRINCETLLMVLREVTESVWIVEPTVFLRPYKLFVRHEDAIRKYLQELEAKWSLDQREFSQGLNQAGAAPVHAKPKASEAPITGSFAATEAIESYQALQSLRCLVEFMDQDVLPLYKSYRTNVPEKIHFRDLWHLYRPGDIVVSWRELDNTKNTASGVAFHESKSSEKSPGKSPVAVWKVFQVSKGRPVLGTPHLEAAEERPQPPSQKVNNFTIVCYMIGYDGSSFGPVDHTFEISPFEGLREITSFDPCPARYVSNFTEIRNQLVDRGKKFMQYTKPTHCLYVGQTLSNHPAGLPCKPAQKIARIDGHVIIDFKEARREDPKWVIQHGLPEGTGGSGLESEEDYPRYCWKDRTWSVLEKTISDVIYDDNHLDGADKDELITSDPFLSAVKNPIREEEVDGRNFSDLDFALLPDRVVGFDLHRRKFSILALDCLHSVGANKKGWADLKLPRGHKTMVQAQIKTHFMEKRLREQLVHDNIDPDLVRGKGQGLIILLHGAPGVGKTSTAECVAESLRKPLYPITCGDLGVTASIVEETLSNTFAKAEAWDCVLLLDEADVFLAQRTRADLKRNAIVSVFLRVLEYYKGILILTTNRVGAFDEAFKSRIHLHLYYPVLNKDQTLAIWKMNLDRILNRKQGNLIVDELEILQFAEQHFEYHKNGNTRWNGRQIRNAFQTALAMAEYEALDQLNDDADWETFATMQNAKAHLKVAHFRTVADASSQFDSYIEETIGTTDAGRAFTDRDRADHFKWMPPARPRSQQYNDNPADWTHSSQSGRGFYAPSKLDPFAPLPDHGRGGFSGMTNFASEQSNYMQGQSWGNQFQSWGSASGKGPQGRSDPKSFTQQPGQETGLYFTQRNSGQDNPLFPNASSGPSAQHTPYAGASQHNHGHVAAVTPPPPLSSAQPSQQMDTSSFARQGREFTEDDGY